jgi:hypothetical protein
LVKIKKHVKKYRKVPDFDPLPASLRSLREYISPTVYARFYGNFITITGKLRRFSFQVKLDAGLNGQEMHRIVRAICGRLLLNNIPKHEPGQVFSFSELFDRTQWIQVRKVMQYEVGMVYR